MSAFHLHFYRPLMSCKSMIADDATQSIRISRFDMSCAEAHWGGAKPIYDVMQLKLHKPTMVIGYSLRMCARYVNSTNPGRSNLVFRSKPIAVVEMSNRLIVVAVYKPNRHVVCACAVGRVTRTLWHKGHPFTMV